MAYSFQKHYYSLELVLTGKKISKIISMYSHKGGVSKTTTSFHLGWKFAQNGHKVLLVDLDHQCNLTSYVVGAAENEEKLLDIYQSKSYETVYDKLSPVVAGMGDVTAATKLVDTNHENMKLFAGSFELADFDLFVSFALQSTEALPFTTPLVGALNECIRETARVGEFDVVILDLSPSASAFNRCAIMSSDFFIIPTSPEYFSLQSVKKMSEMLPKWDDDFAKFRKSLKYPLPEKSPKFVGIVSQRFSLTTSPKKASESDNTTGKMATRFKIWLEKIQRESKNLAKTLAAKKMSISEDKFKSAVGDSKEPFNIISISDFRSLAPLSQKYSKPVFSLEDSELESSGAVFQTYIARLDQFDKVFDTMLERVKALCEI